ncbi:hypothetical protein BC826DRAFT_130039 [Russula brevipes]|nr:hypothetical protein BC826DRAFT_130039 [Russula brevipes]
MDNLFPHIRHERGSSEAGHHVAESPKFATGCGRRCGTNEGSVARKADAHSRSSESTPSDTSRLPLLLPVIVDLTTTASMCPLCAEIATCQTSHRLLRLPCGGIVCMCAAQERAWSRTAGMCMGSWSPMWKEEAGFGVLVRESDICSRCGSVAR